VNVTGGASGTVRIMWEEPASPNGVIMAYNIRVQRVGDKGTKVHQDCITRERFVNMSRNYTFPDGLYPGRYSVQIQSQSLAMDSQYSERVFFTVPDMKQALSPGELLAAILLPILFLIMVLVFGGYYYFYHNRLKGLPTIKSANPEYAQNGKWTG